MNKRNEQFMDLAAGYVLGILSDEDRNEFKKMLEEADPESVKLFNRIQHTATMLAAGTEQEKPGWKTKERLIERIYSSSKEPIKIGFFEQFAIALGFDRPAFAMGLSLFLAIMVLSFGIYSTRLRHTIHKQQTQLTEIKTNLEKKNQLLSVIQAPRVDMVIMNGMNNMSKAYGKIIWDPEKKTAILQLSNLPQLPPGKTYQLWIMIGTKSMSAGVFTVAQKDTESFFKISHMAEANKQFITAFKVTLEPSGGMPHPTGETCLVGKLSNNS